MGYLVNKEFHEDVVEVQFLRTDFKGRIWVAGLASIETFDRMHREMNDHLDQEDTEDEGFAEDHTSWDREVGEERTREELDQALGPINLWGILWEDQWFRGKVMKRGLELLDVFLVDLGFLVRVGYEDIAPLSPRFSTVPWRAVEVKLPRSYGLDCEWPVAAGSFLMKITSGRSGTIHIVDRKGPELRAEVTLNDVRGKPADLVFLLSSQENIWEGPNP